MSTRIVSSNGYFIALIAVAAIILFCFAIALLQNFKPTHVSMVGLQQVGELTRCNIYQFFSLGTDECKGLYEEVSRELPLLLLYVARTIAIALLLSVIVVKLLSHKDLFVRRPTLCLAPANEADLEKPNDKEFWEKGGGWELRCRLYNGTQLTLLNLNFIAKLRRPKIREGDWSVINSTIDLTTKTWAIALPFVPLSIRIPLQKDDLDRNNSDQGKLRLSTIQGHDFQPQFTEETADAKSFLVINIEGTIDDSDGHLMESLWWTINDAHDWYSQGREWPINVRPGAEPLKTGSKPKTWKGWEHFEDGTIDNYVFGYGSLMGEWLDCDDCFIANLRGYERDWQATMNNEIEVPGYKIYKAPSGETTPKRVSFLNVSTCSGKDAFVTGVVRKHSLNALANLDRRERNYLRIDITDQVEFLLQNTGTLPKRPYTIWTYTASAAARGRFDGTKETCIVAERYFNDFELACQRIDEKLSEKKQLNIQVAAHYKLQQLQKCDLP
ncbi:MAG: gamma-glutamylcyclotransferase [Candidatus Thiodiazotropha sp. (ex Monitilora ramsayi)]|nr:gamma-glutamylcyclotransferase [Candidatus Thiodiazotropha sp. (ex Monitilora ramsayi)]